MLLRSPILNVMAGAARKASKGVRRDFGEVEQLQVAKKGPADFVSNTDLRVEKVLMEELSRARPGYGLLTEETGAVEGSDKTHRWIVDPIDGTTNFLHGLAQFALSIALERDGELVAGLIYNPITDDLYSAEKGYGAYHNERRLRVSGRRALDEALIATGVPFKGKPGHEQFQAELAALTQHIAGIRRFGACSLDLAFVAAGRFDGFWERNLQPWDMAAGIVVVREAGGFVRDLEGGTDMLSKGNILAAPEGLLQSLHSLLQDAAKVGMGSPEVKG